MVKTMKLKRHFTLLEMLLAMGLLSLIMYSLLSMLSQTQKSMTVGVSKMNASEDARLALNMMESDLSCIDYSTADDMQMNYKDVLTDLQDSDDGQLRKDDEGRQILFQVCCRREDAYGRFTRITYVFGKPKRPLGMGAAGGDSGDASFYTDDNQSCLIMKQEVWNMERGLDNSGNYKEDGWEDYGERILLTNLVDAYAYGEKADGPGVEGCFEKVTISLALMDEQTRQLGFRSAKDAKASYISEKVKKNIEKSIGREALEHRLLRFTRAVYIDLSVKEKLGAGSN